MPPLHLSLRLYLDGLVKSRHSRSSKFVPACFKRGAGVQGVHNYLKKLDSRLHGDDEL